MKDKIKNAYLYAYYECYLQTHIYYKKHRDKNFYSILSLGFPVWLLVLFPLTIFFGNKFEIGKWMYVILIGIAYGYIFLTSKLIGDNDLTDKINFFYNNKIVVRESRRIVLGFVILVYIILGIRNQI